MHYFKTQWPLVLLAATLAVTSRGANAQLAITSAGASQGLSLTTFATGFPSNVGNAGPFGITFSNGGVLVSDALENVRLFPSDTDGQNAATIPVSQNYGANNAIGIAQVGGKIYMAQTGTSQDVVQINANGTFNQLVVSGFNHPVGIVADPFNGHLFVSDQFSRIYDVDPIAKTKTSFVNVPADGLSLSPDGKTLYAAGGNGHVMGFNVATGAQVFDSGFIPGGIDGTAAGTGQFTNDLFVNTNSGTFYEINLNTLSQSLIASGGSRGDFVTVDPSNDTLLITQTDRILRLNGATFTSVPEPSTLACLASFALAFLFVARLKRRSQP